MIVARAWLAKNQSWVQLVADRKVYILPIVVVQSLGSVWLFATRWTAAYQASLSFTISQNLLRLTPIESMMLSNHLILWYHIYNSYLSYKVSHFIIKIIKSLEWHFLWINGGKKKKQWEILAETMQFTLEKWISSTPWAENTHPSLKCWK